MSKCKSCGAEIIWAKTENGKRIPLNAEPDRRFVLEHEGGAREDDSVRVAKSRKTYVSHFTDCPDAGKWRGH